MNYANLKDEDLLCLLQEDNHFAFKEIYKRYWKICYLQVLKKSNNKELAEELTQSIFISLWERRYEQHINQLPAYLLSAVRFSFINHVKRLLRFEQYLNHKQAKQTVEYDSLEQELALKDLKQAIEKGVSLLPYKTREVFRLSRMEYRPVKDIARQLKISEKAVEYHITQSLKTMRMVLKEYLIFNLLLFSVSFIFR